MSGQMSCQHTTYIAATPAKVLCVLRIPSMALTSRFARPALSP